MLKGLSALDLGRVRVSVGYGTHKKGRLLSPVEVAEFIERAQASGSTLAECAQAVRIDQTGLVRFLKLLKLPSDIRHLVDWGNGKERISFSSAVELVRIESLADQQKVANAALELGLDSKEMRQVVQILVRSGRPVEDVLREIVEMRPSIEERHLFVGTVVDPSIVEALRSRTQLEKDEILRAAIARVGIVGAQGRLGAERITLVGDERFGLSMSRVGTDELEQNLCLEIRKEIDHDSDHR